MSAARPLLGALTALALAAAVAGCSFGGEPGDEPQGEPAPTTTGPSASPVVTEPRELVVSVYGDPARMRTYDRIADAFTAANPEVEISLVEQPDAAAAAAGAVNALELGAGPDVFLTDQRYLADLVETGGLEPVDMLLESRGLQFGDDFQRVALTSMSAEDRLQCMPAEMSPVVVYYNKRLVPRRQLAATDVVVPNLRNPTWSWEAFEATARAVAGLDRLGPVKGVYLPPEVGTLAALVRSGGGAFVDSVFDPTEVVLSSDEALETIQEITTLTRDPAVALTREDLRRRDALDWFTKGELGLYVGTRDDLPALREAKGLSFDVAPLPSFGRAHSVADVNGYCINAGTEHLEDAADFVAFAVGKEAAALAAGSDVMVPARLDTIAEEVFRQPGEQPRNSQFFSNSLRRAEPMPYDTSWPEVEEAAEQVFRRLFYGFEVDVETDLEGRLAQLEETSRTLLDDGDETD